MPSNSKNCCSFANRSTRLNWIYEIEVLAPRSTRRLNSAEAGGNAAVIGEKAFKERFGQLPPLPATAFQDAGNP